MDTRNEFSRKFPRRPEDVRSVAGKFVRVKRVGEIFRSAFYRTSERSGSAERKVIIFPKGWS